MKSLQGRLSYTLRMDLALKKWLAGEAKSHDRSINAEILSILKEKRDKEREEVVQAA